MKLVINYATLDKAQYMESPYYNFYCALNGPSLTTRLVNRIFKKGQTPNELFVLMDSNYAETVKTLADGFYGDQHLSMIEVEDENGYTIAYGRIHWAIGDNEKNASIVDIALAVGMDYETAEEFYASFITEVENFISERNEDTEEVTHEVPANNDAYVSAIEMNDEYNRELGCVVGQKTILYDKWIRNKPMVRKKQTPKK